MQCKPGEVLFFDDTPENVNIAGVLGINAILVKTPSDIEHALRKAGFLR